eukprot:337497-Rhodomonas_salina.1
MLHVDAAPIRVELCDPSCRQFCNECVSKTNQSRKQVCGNFATPRISSMKAPSLGRCHEP